MESAIPKRYQPCPAYGGPLKVVEEAAAAVSGTHKSPEGAAAERAGGRRGGGGERSNSWCQKMPKPDAVRSFLPRHTPACPPSDLNFPPLNSLPQLFTEEER